MHIPKPLLLFSTLTLVSANQVCDNTGSPWDDRSAWNFIYYGCTGYTFCVSYQQNVPLTVCIPAKGNSHLRATITKYTPGKQVPSEGACIANFWNLRKACPFGGHGHDGDFNYV